MAELKRLEDVLEEVKKFCDLGDMLTCYLLLITYYTASEAASMKICSKYLVVCWLANRIC